MRDLSSFSVREKIDKANPLMPIITVIDMMMVIILSLLTRQETILITIGLYISWPGFSPWAGFGQ